MAAEEAPQAAPGGKEAAVHARNVVVLIGRLVGDPVLRKTSAGKAVASFAVAVNHPTPNGDGTYNDGLDGFFECEVWDLLAEVVAEKFRKGDEVYLAGSLIQSKWENKEGRKLSRIVVRAKTVGPTLVLPRKRNGSSGTATETAGQPVADEEKVHQPA